MHAKLSEDFLTSLEDAQTSWNSFAVDEEDNPPTYQVNGSAKDMARLLQLIELYQTKKAESGFVKWFDPNGPYPIESCPKHRAFFAAGKDYEERLFMAANRVGKSIAGSLETSYHLTGQYPDWWPGRRFDAPVDAWAVGPDARTVRDTIQRELLGPIGEWGTGIIPAHMLGKWSALQGTPQAIDVIRVRHISGGWSTLGFKNYKQDIQAFMGTSRHVIWCDEECPIEIWNECNIRTATTGGIMLATFTPLQGLTRMVVNFCKHAEFLAGASPIVAVAGEDEDFDEDEADEAVGATNSKAVIQAGWDDAPWLSEETKARLLRDTPDHLKDARSKGIPSMGAGAVFPYPIETLLVDPFAIPDSWPRMYGLDVGWNCTAAVWAALDPNSDTIYLYDEHYQGQQTPQHHAFCVKSRGEWIRGVIDPATRGRSQVDGNRLLTIYKQLGLKLLPAKNEREAGIEALKQRMSSGKFKVFKSLTNFQREYILYRRKLNGKIEDEDDHAIDATRYIINNLQRMASKVESRIATGVKYVPTIYGV